MIEAIAARIAIGIKNSNPEKTASIEVMQYALIGLINNVLTLSLALTFEHITGNFVNTVLFSIAFIALRNFTGGFHLDSSLKCIIVSTCIVSFFPLLPVPFGLMIILQIISILLILIYAPVSIEGNTRIPSKFYPYLKVIGVLLVSSNFIFMNPAISLGFFVQTLTLINFKKRR